MTKQELEKAIEKGESVWVANKYCIPYEVNLTNNHYIDIADNKESLMLAHIDDVELIDYLEYVFKTKEKAQHYHDHANVTRTETLPFLTWEEFLKKECINFNNGKEGFSLYISYINCDHIRILTYDRYNPDGDVIFEAPLTEENFYKAYDECVRLFRGEE